MAPLPVFAYLGLLLSAWAGPVTVINRRKDGTVDVCPLQGRRGSGEFFDIVEGLDLAAPVTRSGRVAVFNIGALHVLLDALGATIEDRCQVAITSHSTEVLSHRLVVPERTRLIVWRDGHSGVFELDPGSRASAMPPDTVGSILRINGLYPADAPTGVAADLFTLDEGND